METNKILNSDFLDIIFDGKNKDYGAYQLRKNYNKRLAKALMTMSGILLVTFVGTVLANSLGKKKEKKMDTEVVMQLDKVPDPPKPIVPPPPPPPPLPAPPPQVKMTAFTPPVIVDDIEVKDPPPTVETLETSKIAAMTQEGSDDKGIIAPPIEKSGIGNAIAPKVEAVDYDKIFIKVEKPATFQDGADGWRRFLERNLQYPDAATENGVQGIVKVQMVVDKLGNVTEVKALNDPGQGLAAEAERVIKKGPKWIPAEQNGQKVTYRFIQSITFQLQ